MWEFKINNTKLRFHNPTQRIIKFYEDTYYQHNFKTTFLINIHFKKTDKYSIKDKLGRKLLLDFSKIKKNVVNIYCDKNINTIFLHNLTIEHLIRLFALKDKSIFLHASSCIINNKGISVMGKRQSGKTTFILKNNYPIISDDLTLIRDNKIIPYSKKINLFGYNFKINPELFSKINFPFKIYIKLIIFFESLIKLISKKLLYYAYASTNVKFNINEINQNYNQPIDLDKIIILKPNKNLLDYAIEIQEEDRQEFIRNETLSLVYDFTKKEKDIINNFNLQKQL